MKSRRVAAKAIRGRASETTRRGTSRITAVALDSKIKASRDLARRVNRYLRHDGWLRERVQAPAPALKPGHPWSSVWNLAVLPGGVLPAVRYK
jgi:hypothetical protein